MKNYDQGPRHPPMLETVPAVVVGVLLVAFGLGAYVGHSRYYLSYPQLFEMLCYFALTVVGSGVAIWYFATRRFRRENEWPHPPLVLSPQKDDRLARRAWEQDAVILGYNVHGQPWLWPDKVRVMQGIVLGMTGAGRRPYSRTSSPRTLCAWSARPIGRTASPW